MLSSFTGVSPKQIKSRLERIGETSIRIVRSVDQKESFMNSRDNELFRKTKE
jgi:hypothetical protein